MKKRIKCYLIFTSFWYRIVMFILLPFLLPGICIIGDKLSDGANMLIVVMMFLSAAEIVSDNWLFGGIQAKNTEKLDYLKTSGRGMGVMRSALGMDLLRRFFSSLGIFAICNVVMQLIGGVFCSLDRLLYLMLASYFLSAAGVLITRYFSMLWANLLTSYIVMILGVFSGMLPGAAPVYCLLFALLGMMISVLAVRIAMKKVKGGYYDK